MATEADVYQGRLRRHCQKCGVEVEVEKPTRVMSRTSNRKWRQVYRTEIARQILWEALCEDCRGFWNDVLRGVEKCSPPSDSADNVTSEHPDQGRAGPRRGGAVHDV